MKKLTLDYIRTKVWAHNALFGQAARAIVFARVVINSTTTTTQAKQTAADALTLLTRLQQELKTRND